MRSDGISSRRSMFEVLVVEDQPAVSQALCVLLDVHDIPCRAVSTPAEAVALARSHAVGVVIQDMNFTPGDTSGREGVELFRRLREIDPELPVVALTAWSSLEAAVDLVKQGASDYLAKPWDDAKLVTTVRNLLRLRELQLENRRLRGERRQAREALARRHDLRGLFYESEAMHRVVALAVQVAASDVPVLITGPNGAGKEKLAEIVQANSRRAGKPFVKVNAGALPDGLIEAELFGAEPGAYTGATRRRVGRFEAADGGTLFLDEIGNLSPAGQMRLLRVLQSGEFERLGSSDTQKVDVRLLCATNVDLRQAIAEGRFREDLYFRLNVIELALPPLRERPEDVLPLAERFREGFDPKGRRFSEAARSALAGHAWPGNVRELMNRVQRGSLVAAGEEIGPGDLGFGGPAAPAPASAAPAAEPAALAAGEEAERRQVQDALRAAGGSVSRAAETLGLSRQALYRRMERLGIILERRLRG